MCLFLCCFKHGRNLELIGYYCDYVLLVRATIIVRYLDSCFAFGDMCVSLLILLGAWFFRCNMYYSILLIACRAFVFWCICHNSVVGAVNKHIIVSVVLFLYWRLVSIFVINVGYYCSVLNWATADIIELSVSNEVSVREIYSKYPSSKLPYNPYSLPTSVCFSCLTVSSLLCCVVISLLFIFLGYRKSHIIIMLVLNVRCWG